MTESWIDVAFPVSCLPSQRDAGGRAKTGGREPDGGTQRVDVFLARRLHPCSRAIVQRWIREGRVLLRGSAAKASSRVQNGDSVVVRYPKRREPPPRHDALSVLYEDDCMLAVDKPGDLLSHPTGKVVRDTATAIVARRFPGRRLHLAHRLDRETSGVLMFAKDPVSARLMQQQFDRREILKEYLAAVWGRVGFASRIVDRPIAREGGEIRIRQAVADSSPKGQPAVTVFERVRAGESLSVVRARPRTGRLHQVRVHLASLGHPVVGDKLYTGNGEYFLKAVFQRLTPDDLRQLGAPRQMLHASRLTLRHPRSGRGLTLTAPPPDDFMRVLRAFGLKGRASILTR
ncbi:MAG: RluA family pseudouridine synthase [Elusimicrobiota bacterium]